MDHHIGETSWKPTATPDAIELNQRLRGNGRFSAHAVAFEVSSQRHRNIRLRISHLMPWCLQNLTRDHLDYHGDMESYFKTKQRLFLIFCSDQKNSKVCYCKC